MNEPSRKQVLRGLIESMPPRLNGSPFDAMYTQWIETINALEKATHVSLRVDCMSAYNRQPEPRH